MELANAGRWNMAAAAAAPMPKAAMSQREQWRRKYRAATRMCSIVSRSRRRSRRRPTRRFDGGLQLGRLQERRNLLEQSEFRLYAHARAMFGPQSALRVSIWRVSSEGSAHLAVHTLKDARPFSLDCSVPCGTHKQQLWERS